jgi:hypothetical protein
MTLKKIFLYLCYRCNLWLLNFNSFFKSNKNLYYYVYKINYFISIFFYFLRASKSTNIAKRLKTVELEHVDVSLILKMLNNFKFRGVEKSRFADVDVNSKYILYSYPIDYLNQVKYEDDFDRSIVSSWIEDRVGELIRRKLCSQYRIEHIWIYKTLNSGIGESYNLNSNFHTDGDLPGAIKFLVYLSIVNEGSGPFMYELNGKTYKVLGSPGDVVFFKRYIRHAGSNTISEERYCLSCLCYPTISKYPILLSNSEIAPFNMLHTKNPFNTLK